MMVNERKLAAAPLIPLEIDAASILSLSKGVIFDTVVHNIEYTLNNRRTDPLPWKLNGMSLICDSSRNKNYMQKLQKMQCVPSVICTQIYHSKLVKTEFGALTTPGRKIVIPTEPRKRLTGIIVCRSIDELLYMEPPNTENVHFIQYKLLSYERLATREVVNGPKLPSVGEKIIKTVFDFELSDYHFPRQLLPVAIISFLRQDGCDLCASIRSFLSLDAHKIFDKSYLVTSTNVEFDRLREEQERKEDAEAEQQIATEKVQRRQPLADLPKKNTGNARPPSIPQPPLRVPPLKIKVPRPEKPTKPSVPIVPLDSKFQCALKLNRVNLSLYDISNLPDSSQIKRDKLNESSKPTDSINNKTKSFNITKPHEHHKPLKRLNNSETKKQSSPPSEIFKEKRSPETISIRSSTSDVAVIFTKDKTNKRSLSISSMSPTYTPKLAIQKRTVEKTTNKKKVQRPTLPHEYRCSLSLARIDLSMYNLDLPATAIYTDTLPMNMESTVSTSPSSSPSSSEQQTEPPSVPTKPENTPDDTQSIFMMEEENVRESEQEIIPNVEQLNNTNACETLPNIVDEFQTPDLNDPSSNSSNEVLPPSTNEILPQNTDESVLAIIEDLSPIPMDDEILVQIISEAIAEAATELLPTTTTKILPEASNELLPNITDEVLPEPSNEATLPTTNEVVSNITDEEYTKSFSPISCVLLSPELPQIDDDPVLFSIESPQIPVTDTSDSLPQDCIIIVPCSDDEDDYNEEMIDNKNNIIPNNTDSDNKIVETLSSPVENNTYSIINNPTLARVFMSASRLPSHRSSTSSSCSSISTSILHNQSPRSPLHLTEIVMPQKVLNKKQHKSLQPITFIRFNVCIPLSAQEPLIDPRLIYRLKSITTDLRWPSPCNRCSISEHLSSLFTSTTQIISYDRKYSCDFVDPRRESLKTAILNYIHHRIKILIPNIFIINSNEFQKLLFEQTIFKTNCSLHLEYLLHKLKLIDNMNFFHMIKTNDEFQLSPFLLQLIFN